VGKKLVESEMQSRLAKYTSHVAFHLYQMYQQTVPTGQGAGDESRRDPEPEQQRAEINRVAMTVLKLMQVSR
jgi:hypothetical protein